MIDIINIETAIKNEIWHPIPSLDGYEASSLGRIRAPERLIRCPPWNDGENFRCVPAGILKHREYKTKCGNVYHIIGIMRKTRLVNRLVCEAFHGEAPSPKHHAAHLNGISTENFPDNLIWATPAENEYHKKSHGTDPVGSRNGLAILTEDSIANIFTMFISGKSYVQIGEQFKINFSHVGSIIRREVWSHVHIDDTVLAEVKKLLKIKRSIGSATSAKKSRERAILKNRLLTCQCCGSEFRTRNALQDTRKYCSAKCYNVQRRIA